MSLKICMKNKQEYLISSERKIRIYSIYLKHSRKIWNDISDFLSILILKNGYIKFLT